MSLIFIEKNVMNNIQHLDIKKVNRSEDKFLINSSDIFYFKSTLNKILPIDENIDDFSKSYNVQSIYFDTIFNDDLRNKLDGNKDRKKIRIRVYNKDLKTAKLEIKHKSSSYSKKISQKLTSEEVSILLNSNLNKFLEKNTFIRDYFLTNNEIIHPTSVVTYDRFAFKFPISNIRITIDTDIRGHGNNLRFPITNIANGLRLTPNFIDVVEVKYDGTLPTVIKNTLSQFRLLRSAVSKYTLSRFLNDFQKYSDKTYLHY